MKAIRLFKLFSVWLMPFLLPMAVTAAHGYVDLGLPSGTLWADCNVGASASEQYGDFYAWGETQTKTSYTWSNYQYASGSQSTVQDIGTHIAGTSYDVAKAKWGSEWVMPTLDQANELIHYCDLSLAKVNNVKGIRFKGPNGNSIFFPMTGYKADSGYQGEGSQTYIWTDTKDIVNNVAYKSMAIFLDRGSSPVNIKTTGAARYSGCVIRPVKKDGNGGGDVTEDTPYAVFSGTTLTFYYDEKMATRNGTKYELNTGTNKPGWNAKASSITKVVFDASFADAYPTTTYYWFGQMSKLTSITGLENLMTEDVTNMAYMFYGCSQLQALDLGTFKTSSVKSMAYMFSGCTSLTNLTLYYGSYGLEYFYYDTNFVTTAATNLSNMFAGCSSLSALVLADFTVKSSTNTTDMLKGCSSLYKLYITTDMNALDASALAGVGTASNPCCLEFHEWDAMPQPSSIKPTYYVWKGGYFYNLQTGYAELSEDGKTMTFKYDIFDDLSWTGTPIPIYKLNSGTGKPEWVDHAANVTKVVFEERFAFVRPTSCYQWFNGLTKLASFTGLKYLNTSEVTNMAYMFQNCKKLTSLDISTFTLKSGVTSTSMLKNCTALKKLSIPATAGYLNNAACTGIGTTSSPCELVYPSGFTPERQSSGTGWFQWKGGYFKDDVQPSQYAIGDVNHDGSITVVDATLVTDYVLGNNPPNFHIENADANSDGSVTITDVTKIIDLVLGGSTPPTPPSTHNYVDLGLPSGTLWADCNVGASAPEEYGDFYAWGETDTKASYTWGNYEYASGSQSTVQNIGTHLAGTSYDVATAKWGSEWVMPTLDQANELIHYCDLSLAKVNNVKGIRFKGPNGNSIFFPMTGYKADSGYQGEGSQTYIWTDTKDIVSNVAYKSMTIFMDRGSSPANIKTMAALRCSGCVIRPVRK